MADPDRVIVRALCQQNPGGNDQRSRLVVPVGCPPESKEWGSRSQTRGSGRARGGGGVR